MKFRRGLNSSLQNQIATLGEGRPKDNDPEAWYAAARLHEQSCASNVAFVNSRPTPAPIRQLIPVRPNPFIPLHTPADLHFSVLPSTPTLLIHQARAQFQWT